jgi:hypothetical protein
MSNNNTMTVSEAEKIQIMKEIEYKTGKIVETALVTGKLVNPVDMINGKADKKQIPNSTSILVNIMQKGADEFEQKMGRPMTYSEMREMYG